MSVDEILNAKKKDKSVSIVGNENKVTPTEKVSSSHNTDVVINYLVHKSIDKFKMMAVVSILLSVIGIILQYFIWAETKDLTGWIFGCWLEICSAGIFYYYERLMKNQIRDYNAAAEVKLNAKEISKQYWRCLIIIWVLMILILVFLFYINKMKR